MEKVSSIQYTNSHQPKIFSFTKQQLKCLQQRSQCSSSSSVWLNDQVCVYNFIIIVHPKSLGAPLFRISKFHNVKL